MGTGRRNGRRGTGEECRGDSGLVVVVPIARGEESFFA